MAIFGGSGFIRTYGDNRPDLTYIYRHGGIAIRVYVFFYFAIFGRDEVKRMFLKALFGLLRIGVQVGWLLNLFDRDSSTCPLSVYATRFCFLCCIPFSCDMPYLTRPTASTTPRAAKP